MDKKKMVGFGFFAFALTQNKKQNEGNVLSTNLTAPEHGN